MADNQTTSGGVKAEAEKIKIGKDAVGRDKKVDKSTHHEPTATANPTITINIGTSILAVVLAVIAGAIVTFTVLWLWKSPLVNQPERSPLTTSSPHREDYVQFGSASNPGELNPALKWWLGESKDSGYKIGERSLTITAGPRTNQVSTQNSAPIVTYPITGDFTAQVMMIFDPSDGQYAGLGIKSVENDTTWLRITTRAHNSNGDDVVFSTNDQGNFDYGNSTSYSKDVILYNQTLFSKDVIHFRIERRGKIFNMFYSPDGNNWSSLGEKKPNLSSAVEIYLIALSDSANDGTAQFRDLKITQP